MTAHAIASVTSHRSNHGRGVLGWLMQLDATFRQRSALADLEPHRLADLGLDAAAVRDEVSRSFL